jgi:hypothetical protein
MLEVSGMRSLLPVLALIAFLPIGCGDDLIPLGLTLPEPTAVPAGHVPGPRDEIYYLIAPPEGAEPALMSLLESGIGPRDAWYPVHGSPCLAPTAVDALVVRLPWRDERILQLGFLAEPGIWLINCGVDSLWHYAFRR